MSNPFQPAIDELEKEARNLEVQLGGLHSTIAFLREKAGLPPRNPTGGGIGNRSASNSQNVVGTLTIQPDAYFGKKMGSAAREYLLARKAAGLTGPATPKEIFEALKEGGFPFGSKDDANARIVLGTMLRKSSNIFQKIGAGSYGLKAWYGDGIKSRPVRHQPSTNGTSDITDEMEEASTEGFEENPQQCAVGVI